MLKLGNLFDKLSDQVDKLQDKVKKLQNQDEEQVFHEEKSEPVTMNGGVVTQKEGAQKSPLSVKDTNVRRFAFRKSYSLEVRSFDL